MCAIRMTMLLALAVAVLPACTEVQSFGGRPSSSGGR